MECLGRAGVSQAAWSSVVALVEAAQSMSNRLVGWLVLVLVLSARARLATSCET